MICKQCKEQGRTSTVVPLGGFTTLMGWHPYYDESGVYHSHDPNRHESSYRCSNGHNWAEEVYAACPATGCSYQERPWPSGRTVVSFEEQQ